MPPRACAGQNAPLRKIPPTARERIFFISPQTRIAPREIGSIYDDSRRGERNPNGLGQFTFNLRFPGQVYDQESGLFYNGARYYDPSTGRFPQSDPIGLAGGSLSTYAAVNNNPLSYIDPNGLAACTYSVSTHTLVCSPDAGGDAVTLGPTGVWSGVGPCANSASCTSYNDVGPIVPGKYNMNEDNRPGHETFWRLEPNPQIPGWKCRVGAERCGFELHPGGTSLGCITTDKKNTDAMDQYKNVNDLLNREKGQYPNRLTVIP